MITVNALDDVVALVKCGYRVSLFSWSAGTLLRNIVHKLGVIHTLHMTRLSMGMMVISNLFVPRLDFVDVKDGRVIRSISTPARTSCIVESDTDAGCFILQWHDDENRRVVSTLRNVDTTPTFSSPIPNETTNFQKLGDGGFLARRRFPGSGVSEIVVHTGVHLRTAWLLVCIGAM